MPTCRPPASTIAAAPAQKIAPPSASRISDLNLFEAYEPLSVLFGIDPAMAPYDQA